MNEIPKSIFESRTFWIAFCQGLTGVLMVIIELYPGLGWAMIGKSIIDVIIRLLTSKPVNII